MFRRDADEMKNKCIIKDWIVGGLALTKNSAKRHNNLHLCFKMLCVCGKSTQTHHQCVDSICISSNRLTVYVNDNLWPACVCFGPLAH